MVPLLELVPGTNLYVLIHIAYNFLILMSLPCNEAFRRAIETFAHTSRQESMGRIGDDCFEVCRYSYIIAPGPYIIV